MDGRPSFPLRVCCASNAALGYVYTLGLRGSVFYPGVFWGVITEGLVMTFRRVFFEVWVCCLYCPSTLGVAERARDGAPWLLDTSTPMEGRGVVGAAVRF